MSIVFWIIYILLFFIITTLAQTIYATLIHRYRLNSRFIPIIAAVLMISSLYWLGEHWITLLLVSTTVGIAVAHEEPKVSTRRIY